MKSFLNRFAKTVRSLTISVVLLLCLTVNVLAAGTDVVAYSTYYIYQNSGFISYTNSSMTADKVPAGAELYFGTTQDLSSYQIDRTAPYVQIDFVYEFSAAYGGPKFDTSPFQLKYSCDYNFQSLSSFQMSYLQPIEVLNSSFVSINRSKGTCSYIIRMSEYDKLFRTQTNKNVNLLFLAEPALYENGSSGNLLWIMTAKQSWSSDVEYDPTVSQHLSHIADQVEIINSNVSEIESAVNEKYVNPDEVDKVENSMEDHSAAEAEVQNALDEITNMEITDEDGNPINISIGGGYLQNIENYFDFKLDGFEVTNAANIFRKTLTGYIGLFGSFIFFPLVLGILGALLGRNASA